MDEQTTQPTQEQAPVTDTAPVQAPITTNTIPTAVKVTLLEQIAALGGKFVNDTTSVGKAGKAAKWSALSVIVIAALTAITAQPAIFLALHWGALVVVANVLLVFFSNLTDKNTPNF